VDSSRFPLLAFRDAAIAALLAGVLGLPLIGFRLADQAGGEVLVTRWPELFAAIALTFIGRLALGLVDAGAHRLVVGFMALFAAGAFFIPWPSQFLMVVAIGGAVAIALIAGHAWVGPRPAASVGAAIKPVGRYLPWLLIAFALALPTLPFANRGVVDAGTLILTYVLLGWGLNIVTGLAGLLDLGYVAFLAIGAYTTAILSTRFGLTFWECLPLAAIAASSAGILLGFPVLRLRGDYFAIVTLGFGEIIRIIANNWRSLTNGSQGISNLPRPSFFGLADFTASPAPGHMAFNALFGIAYNPMHRVIFLYYVVLVLALAVNVFTLRIRRLPIGRMWEALREDEIAAQALGIDRRRIKLAAFAIGAAWGGIAGVVFDARQGFVTPESFGFIESVMVTAIVVLGGMGSQLGIVLAALVLVGLPELFRELEGYRMLAFSAAMIAIMRFRPRGLIANRRPTAVLK
jgi:branched-chain amino acid transport system permease protein